MYSASSSLEYVAGGTARPIAGSVTMDQILVDCGDEPVEVGAPVVLIGRQGSASIGAEDWAGLLVKAGTPSGVVARLNGAIDKALKSEKVNAALAKLGVDPGGGPPEAFGLMMHNEIARWGTIVREANIKIQQ